MKKYALIIGLLIWSMLPLESLAATFEEPVQLPPGRTDQRDKSQEDDCDCCQKCKAAKKPITSSEEGTEQDNKTGCEQCCERCGRKLPGAPEDTPPDIIEKGRSRD